MATPSLSLSITLLLGGLLLPTTSAVHSDKHSALFTFGDSLYDPGTNNYINTTTDFQANFLPYGESFFTCPTGRFSDGRLIPDFIAEYAKLPLIPAYLKPGDHQFEYGANFASGGAGALVESHQGFVIDLHTQLSYFKDVVKLLRQKLGDKVAKQLLCNAVYLISIGGNDYLARSSIYQSYPIGEYVELVFGNLSTVIKVITRSRVHGLVDSCAGSDAWGIYEEGGRKFGFVNMPPLGCLPNTRTQTPGSTGFKDGTSACCGSGPLGGVYSCGGMRGIEEYELCEQS
ncbi:GDSL-motif lipase 5 [Actinidia rufa]|uniref:GDSL-motif lipase 5 n=1 Tax=Actinidia rufa TaxID=165716 RepID=A0A7J0G0P5_9ERIC|nr:GDSL-motif lipase 5 [Actinidia rufa]